MLEKVDLTKKMPKDEYKAKMPQLEARLGQLQRQCKELKIPVIIVFEGFGASGKGVQIGRLIQSMDPRGFQVYPIKNETEEERMHPFLWRFWTKTPERGRIAIFDGSWYRRVLIDRFEKRTKAKELPGAFHSINSFEEQLADDGNVIIKLFLDIDRKEQKKRFDKLAENKETAWRVTQGDLERNARYDEYAAMMEDMLFSTDKDYAPWTIIESTDRRFATVKIYTTVIKAMADQIEKVLQQNAEKPAPVPEGRTGGLDAAAVAREADRELRELQVSILSKADLSLKYTREEYKKKLEKLHLQQTGHILFISTDDDFICLRTDFQHKCRISQSQHLVTEFLTELPESSAKASPEAVCSAPCQSLIENNCIRLPVNATFYPPPRSSGLSVPHRSHYSGHFTVVCLIKTAQEPGTYIYAVDLRSPAGRFFMQISAARRGGCKLILPDARSAVFFLNICHVTVPFSSAGVLKPTANVLLSDGRPSCGARGYPVDPAFMLPCILAAGSMLPVHPCSSRIHAANVSAQPVQLCRKRVYTAHGKSGRVERHQHGHLYTDLHFIVRAVPEKQIKSVRSD